MDDEKKNRAFSCKYIGEGEMRWKAPLWVSLLPGHFVIHDSPSSQIKKHTLTVRSWHSFLFFLTECFRYKLNTFITNRHRSLFLKSTLYNVLMMSYLRCTATTIVFSHLLKVWWRVSHSNISHTSRHTSRVGDNSKNRRENITSQ